MLHKNLNGYTIVAHEYNRTDGLYWILGSRRLSAGAYEYVVAGVRNFDLDTQWVTSGHYPATLRRAFEIYSEKAGV